MRTQSLLPAIKCDFGFSTVSGSLRRSNRFAEKESPKMGYARDVDLGEALFSLCGLCCITYALVLSQARGSVG